MRPFRALIVAVALFVPLLAAPSAPAAAKPLPELRWTRVLSGFDQPTDIALTEGDRRKFVTEKTGLVRVVRDGKILRRPYLDLRSKVSTSGERGLLSLVFHPDFARRHRFWVFYTAHNGDLVVACGSAESAPPPPPGRGSGRC